MSGPPLTKKSSITQGLREQVGQERHPALPADDFENRFRLVTQASTLVNINSITCFYADWFAKDCLYVFHHVFAPPMKRFSRQGACMP